MITYRYAFGGFDTGTLIDAIGSMGVDATGVVVASAPSNVFIDVATPDNFDVTKLDSVVSYPYLWTRVGVVTTPNARVAFVRAKRTLPMSVSNSAEPIEWNDYSMLLVHSNIDIVDGDLVPRISGAMNINCRVEVDPLALMTSLTMRVIVNPGPSQVIIHDPPEGPTIAKCGVDFNVVAGVPVRIDIAKNGGIGSTALELAETRTYCSAKVIAP
jgi:hypothetical protein